MPPMSSSTGPIKASWIHSNSSLYHQKAKRQEEGNLFYIVWLHLAACTAHTTRHRLKIAAEEDQTVAELEAAVAAEAGEEEAVAAEVDPANLEETAEMEAVK